MLERRKRPRLRVLKSAKLVLRKSSVFDCVMHDLTNVGAGIETYCRLRRARRDGLQGRTIGRSRRHYHCSRLRARSGRGRRSARALSEAR